MVWARANGVSLGAELKSGIEIVTTALNLEELHIPVYAGNHR